MNESQCQNIFISFLRENYQTAVALNLAIRKKQWKSPGQWFSLNCSVVKFNRLFHTQCVVTASNVEHVIVMHE